MKKMLVKWWIPLCLAVVLVSACSQSPTNSKTGGAQPVSSNEPKATAGSSEIKQHKVPTTVAEIATYEGQDRQQLLMDAAKKEGTLNLYTSMNIETGQKIVDNFQKKYGIKVTMWRASSEDIVLRTIQEAKAGRHELDVVETNGPEMESLHREKVLQEVKSPLTKDLIPQAVFPHKEWVATRLNVFVQSYNTGKVKKEDIPKTFEDLLDPRWKGRLAIEEGDVDWFFTVVKSMGEDKAIKLFRDIVEKNGISVRKGHALLSQMVASGEVPLALTVYSYKAEQDKKAGALEDWYSIGDAIARPNGVGITKTAPHPHAAILFYDYMISEETQKMLSALDFTPTNKKADAALEGMKMILVDPGVALDEDQKWRKIFNEIFLKKK